MDKDGLVLRIPAASLILVFVAVLASIFVWSSLKGVIRALTSYETLFAIGLSLATALAAAGLALALGIPVAYAMARGLLPGGRAAETLLLIPFGMPPVAVGAALLIFFTNTPPGSLLDELLSIVFTPRGLVVAQFFVVYPMALRVLKTSFASVDPRYEAVARTLGYTRLQTLLRVTLPMARRGLLSAFLLAFIRALGEFGASVTLAGAIRFKTETLPIAIYLSISGGDLNLAVALMTVSILVAGVSVAALLALEKRE